MNKADQIARGKLVDYARKFLNVTAQPDEPISVTPERVAAFAAQVREGCRQDLIRLLQDIAKENIHETGDEALLSLSTTMEEGDNIELWGLPDCACGKPECVYCGRGFNIPSTLEKAEHRA